MQVEPQTEVIAFLTEPATHKLQAGTVETIETHISVIVLAGERAFKLKRAVKLPYVDFSTADLRFALCEREVELNRRTVPELYLGVRRITRTPDGRLAFDGDGPLVDAVVEMVRFGQDHLFDRMALHGGLTSAHLSALAGVVARFHETAAPEFSGSGAANVASVLTINERAFAATNVFDPQAVAALNHDFREALARHAPLLDQRQRAGKVRHCHGDLHLRNICLFADRPSPFDCLEFSDAMATIDILYDLAFLLMDLWHRDFRAGANLVLNRYLDELDESDGLPLVPFFMAIRAAVRAHISAARSADPSEAGDADTLRREAAAYFELASQLLQPRPPRLVTIGGFSGSGKSTAAAAVAPAIGAPPGARVLTSDRIRKRMSGVEPTTHLPATAYRPEVSRAVYDTLAREAEYYLALGHGVVLDAVFDRAEDRSHVAAIATAVGVPFTGLWLEADEDVLIERVEKRRDDPSDATQAIVHDQIARFAGNVEWLKIEAGGDADDTARRVVAAL